jgi:hypothetical protein
VALTCYRENKNKIDNPHWGCKPGSKTIVRHHIDIKKYFEEMDDKYFCHQYRMNKNSFYNLLDIVQPHMRSDGKARACGSTPNGIIVSASKRKWPNTQTPTMQAICALG